MNLPQFDYELPEELIAQEMVEPRDESRLMIISSGDGKIQSDRFINLDKYLGSDTVLVFNETKVLPARLFGEKISGGKVEVLLVKQVASNRWEAISKPGLKKGVEVRFDEELVAEVESLAEEGVMCLKFNLGGIELMNKLYSIGKTPLPPYINSKRVESEVRRQYQTIYAKTEGSVAAPTAGFHFTSRLMERLEARGVEMEFVTLHVSLGTFRPVKTDNIEDHLMHSERFSISSETVEKLRLAKAGGKKIIAVGTTASRVLESCVGLDGNLQAGEGETGIFIYPGYKFKFVDGLITNFHLPKSTLLMLVSALASKPNTEREFIDFKSSLIGKGYGKAINEGWKFFSYGDGMMIL